MIVQHNILAMNANRNVKLNTSKVSTNTKKLASGYRINNSADDAAGLAISEKMRKQIRGLSQGSSNAQEGISMVQTAEGALNEVHDMIQRMNELAIQAANETCSDSDRAALQAEFEDLQEEIDRISETTTFNEKVLFSSGIDEVDYDEVSAIRGRFNAEIQGKISGVNDELADVNIGNGTNNGTTVINNGAAVIDNSQNQVGTYSLRSVARDATTSELPVGTGIIDLSKLTSDLEITDTGYTLNGVEHSYKGSYMFSGTTTQSVIITSATDDSRTVTISVADGTTLKKLDIRNNADVRLTTEKTANINSVSVGNSSIFYLNKNGSNLTDVNIGNISNSGSTYLQNKVNLNGTFSNYGSMYIQNSGQLNIDNGDANKVITNNGNMYIYSGCVLEVVGNLTNKYYISNSGTLNISGNVNNSNTFSSSGKLSVGGDINNTSGSSTISGTATVRGDINNTGGSTSASGTTTIVGNVNNTVGSTSLSGTTTVGLNINISSGTVSTSGKVTVTGAVSNNGTLNVNKELNVYGTFTNYKKLNVNGNGILNVHNDLLNSDNILIDGGGTLVPKSTLNNEGTIRINTFGYLNGTDTEVSIQGNIDVEDHYKMNEELIKKISINRLNTITLNMTMLPDVSLSDTYLELTDKDGTTRYNNEVSDRIYRIKGQTSHSNLDDLNIVAGNVNVYVEETKMYVDNFNVAQGAYANIRGGKFIANEIMGDADISNELLFKYSNGSIKLGSEGTLTINKDGYVLSDSDLKYYIESYNSISLEGSSDNVGDTSNEKLNIVIDDGGRSIYVRDSTNCFVNKVTINATDVNIYNNRLIAKTVVENKRIKEEAQLYMIDDGNIEVDKLEGELTIGDDYYKYSNSNIKRHYAGEYTFSGENPTYNVTITSPNVINVADDCKIGKLTYASTQATEVKGAGKIICEEVANVYETDVIDEKILAVSPFVVNLSDVNDSLFITKDGYKKDNINYLVEDAKGITLQGSTNKNVYVDSDRVVSLDEVDITGDLVVLQPTEGSIQVVNESSVANLVVESGSAVSIYGLEPLHLTGESFNMGTMLTEKLDIRQEGIFTNTGEFINQTNIINEGLISNAEEGMFVNKASIQNEGIINNFAKLENEKEAVIVNNKFIYNIGEINNKTDAQIDNNNVIENKYKLRNKGTLDNYEGSIDNYYSVAGIVLGNQPMYIYDGSRTENSLDIQAGAEKDDKIYIDIFQMNSRVLGIQKDRVNIRTVEDTTNAIVGVSFALEKLSKQRSMLGSYQNRLEHAIKNLDNAVENTTSAESSIRDTDMAKEMVEYSNNNILSQSAQAMLAQANQLNSGVLSLLN